jgi:nuclear transport factor 2 (NTF2) superfamily protein
VSEFTDQYDKVDKFIQRKLRRELEAEVAKQLTAIYGRVWSKGKIAVKASKMVDTSMRAGKAAQN